MAENRREEARQVRDLANQMAHDRAHPLHENNGDEKRYSGAGYAMSFTKGLDHDPLTGLVRERADYEAFRAAVDNGFVEDFTRNVPVPRAQPRRKWEAPTAGLVYELQGPDPQAVTMAPAPPLCSDELTFEMAEVYELALLRDVPFSAFKAGGVSADLTASIARLNALAYAAKDFPGRPRKSDDGGDLDAQTVFRGASPGVDKGPYLSQLMLVGNASPDSNPTDGYINFGAQRIDQRVLEAALRDDYMMTWEDWLAVQQGYDVNAGPCNGQPRSLGQDVSAGTRRFITTPRDLATYVHIDALYQAYLNGCLILLGNGTPFDPGFDLLSGGGAGMLNDPLSNTRVPLNAGGFALWGGPHILSLVTEVATRGLKAVRYQKFNSHSRLRPEALAGRLEKAEEIEAAFPSICGCLSQMAEDLCETIEKIREHNDSLVNVTTALLPMAFAEGSPMHPAYGAGHATVAGACVTILKAYFDTAAVFVTVNGVAGFHSSEQIRQRLECGDTVEAGAYEADATGYALTFECYGTYALETRSTHDDCEVPVVIYTPKKHAPRRCPLTLEGELNKLAANISIGRNMAGVHYFSDYYDSVRMGEEIAIGILEEQALCYTTNPFVLSVPTFDGPVRRIGER